MKLDPELRLKLENMMDDLDVEFSPEIIQKIRAQIAQF